MDEAHRRQVVLGARIRSLRLTRGETQASLARAMRVEFRTWRIDTVSKIEAGSRALLATEAPPLAVLLGVSLYDLLVGPVFDGENL
jgi:transcriptional regulator with XRE-family HTH domain